MQMASEKWRFQFCGTARKYALCVVRHPPPNTTHQIPPEEKVKAVNLMGEDDSELPHRKQVQEENEAS